MFASPEGPPKQPRDHLVVQVLTVVRDLHDDERSLRVLDLRKRWSNWVLSKHPRIPTKSCIIGRISSSSILSSLSFEH
jgi:hypothetical protein